MEIFRIIHLKKLNLKKSCLVLYFLIINKKKETHQNINDVKKTFAMFFR